jgi:uncharacterized protein YjbI with pentapeptide repeats
MPADSELWIPPLSPKDQKKANRRQKYRGLVKWTGFPGKTLWDWLQLLSALAIPVVIAAGTLWFTAQQSQASTQASDKQHQTDLQVANDQQQETALQTYLDRMSDLLLNSKLGESQPGDEVRNIAQSRTLTVLPQLNGTRKGELVHFLKEAGLIEVKNTIVNLSGADLSRADLSEINLNGANLREANLNRINLKEADLSEANLNAAILSAADLSGATLSGATLSEADLSAADLSRTDLSEANLNGANLNGANLSLAVLSGATLNRDHLSGTTLNRDHLSEAILNRDHLSGAILSRDHLSGIYLISIDLKTNLSYANLSYALQLHFFRDSLPKVSFGEKLFSLRERRNVGLEGGGHLLQVSKSQAFGIAKTVAVAVVMDATISRPIRPSGGS